MKTFYFTSTGNCLAVAKQIGGELISIPQAFKQNQMEFEDEKIGFIFPCYAWGVPEYVEEFLSKASFKAKYFFTVMTYGKMAAGGLMHIQSILGKKGIQLDYTEQILMVDNYLPMLEMKKEKEKPSNLKIDQKVKRIASEISQGKIHHAEIGIVANMMTKTMNCLRNKIFSGKSDRKFTIEDSCTGCEICAQVCPKDNITIENNRPVFHNHCMVCFGCTHHCPQNAIRLKGEQSKERFIHPDITLKEIIKANK